jgi:3-oxoacid CoA-transferase A subunit
MLFVFDVGWSLCLLFVLPARQYSSPGLAQWFGARLQQSVSRREYVLEKPLKGDFALIKAYKTDPRGNLIYRKTARNFNPIMAMAADFTIAEVQEDVAIDDLDPEIIVTPGVFVDTYYVTGWYEIGKARNA